MKLHVESKAKGLKEGVRQTLILGLRLMWLGTPCFEEDMNYTN